MAVEKVSQHREMRGYCVTVSITGMMSVAGSNLVAKNITKFLDFLELKAQEFEP